MVISLYHYTYITDNSSPARILSFKKWSCSPQLMLLMSCCVLVWSSTLHLSSNDEVSSVRVRVASFVLGTTAADTNMSDKKKCWILQHIWQPRVRGGGLYSNLKVNAVAVLATILHTAALITLKPNLQIQTYLL